MRTPVRTATPVAGHRPPATGVARRFAAVLWLAAIAGPWPAGPAQGAERLAPEAADPLDSASRLLAAGAPALALRRLASAPDGIEARRLRAEAAGRLPPGPEGDRQRVAAAEALTGIHEPWAVSVRLEGAAAALRTDAGAAGAVRARRMAAAAIWSPAAREAAVEQGRRLIVRGLFAEGLEDEAYAALLRWRLDMPQADPARVAEMAALLVGTRHAREALPLLAALEPASPSRLLLQARLGLTPPAEAAQRLRSALGQGAPAWFWRHAREVGRAAGDPVLAVEAGLRLAAAGEPFPVSGRAGTRDRDPVSWADALRAELRDAAVAAATDRQLLTGDDFGWMDEAGRLAATDPPRARALFAGMASSGATAGTREHARLQWVISMRESGLGRAATLLFPPGASDLPPDVARQLGAAAASAGQPEVAIGYWRSLPGPGGGEDRTWALTLAQVLVDTGEHDEAVRRLRRAAGVAPAADPGLIALAERMTDAGVPAQALALLEGMVAPAGLIRPLQLARARAAEAEGLLGRPDRPGRVPPGARGPILPPEAAFALAAAGFLAAAAAAPGPGDAAGLEARLRAARNLERAGARAAARSEYEAVARQSRDPGLRDLARRALSAY